MRAPKFAGLFYERLESRLNKQIEGCFLGERGPGALPTTKHKGRIQAIISPHAGYTYSGACAAWGFKALAEAEMPDLFILIGPSHHYNQSGFSMETFETPFGMIRVDQQFARMLAEKGHIKQNELIHENEHCLEVQLPFLQFVLKNHMEKIKILPIIVSYDVDLDSLAIDLKETIIDSGKKVVFIVSSDFTHYGSNYHYAPFSADVKQKIYDLDGAAIELIKKQDAKGVREYVDKNMATICGTIPIILLLKTIKAKKVQLMHYYTSGDIAGNYKNSVSYASIVFG